jgi:hypothetical protein
MEAARPFETSVNYQFSRRHNSQYVNPIDPQMNGLIGGAGGPIMPIVWYFRITNFLKGCQKSNTVLYE